MNEEKKLYSSTEIIKDAKELGILPALKKGVFPLIKGEIKFTKKFEEKIRRKR